MEKYEIVKYYENYRKRLNDLENVIDPKTILSKIDNNEEKMALENFWSNQKHATSIIQETTELKEQLEIFKKITELLDELEIIIEMNDEKLFSEVEPLISNIAQRLEQWEISLLMDGEYDHQNAIMELHPGAGGTESQDWALMLYRMYKRYCERNNFNFELIDYLEANEAGLKSVTFIIKGKNAYGKLKAERGIHRLVRISPFDSNARRHTSFVACNVTPEIDSDIQVEINPEDLRIDTYRSSGAGGQHVNTTDSAVRITHIPTGIVVSCQNERSQIQNRERAMQILKSKLFQKQQNDHLEKVRNIGGELSDNAFGSQIRSYILHPYALVKDHRTQAESSNPNNVLDGDIELFINAYLKYQKMK